MNKAGKFLTGLLVFLTLTISSGYSSSFFTGYAGGMLNLGADSSASQYNPELDLTAFFSGQFSYSENFWSHLEFSIETEDLFDQSLFSKTDSAFQVDELSFIKRNPTLNGSNYFSAYMGTYDPIGSDIFLQRYFGIEAIGTKLAESYLGLAGSILYPHFGIGIADVIKPSTKPTAYGFYLYLNNENSQYYILNADLRFATSLRYFTFDICGGIGAPLYDTYKGESIFLVISKIYLHAGTTMLLGNNYTTSLFLQAGLFNTSYQKGSSWELATDSIYLLLEPRFRTKNSHINLSIYALPQTTVDKFLFVDDTLGVDLNIYSDTIPISAKMYTMGVHLGFGLPEKSILSFFPTNKSDPNDNLANLIQSIMSLNFDVNVTPYIATEIFGGEINAQLKLKIMDFVNKEWYKAFSAEVGYRVKF
ncbi:MAG: hypothetical protein K6D95_07755 [Treponema sp.]|nr:hypothetical protein [Treponema sp.]